MSRVIELHQGLVRDPAYAHEIARLEDVLAQMKAVAQAPARVGKPDAAKSKRVAAVAFPPKARSA